MNIRWCWKPFAGITALEMHELLSLRQQVFVVEQNSPYQDADALDEYAWHLLGRDPRGTLVAYARLTFPGSCYSEPSLGRVLVSKSMRGQGFGKALIEESIAQCCREYPGMNIRISAQTYLLDFYQQVGFAVTSEPYDDAGVEHYDMVLHTDN